MKSDSLGYLLSYLETNSQDGVILDCVYEYKRINGKLYRIEKLKLYYGPDQLWEVGQRFLKMTDEGIGTRFASPHKAYGVWTYYTRSGEIEKTKDFGNLE
ncbi:hypothetical protein [Rufibacter roseus]|uniref:Uncharacterized protein n=2 Tax=Rufibacter roseus TaxID=1567108 RepID=A0ABW2DNA6_9BACT|nr:hypothetical protein [Rufibacter roseus]